MEGRILGINQHTRDSQNQFARISGDYNPVHIDTVAARRTLFGQVVVHGVHSVLCALEHYFTDRANRDIETGGLSRLAATFPNPAFLEEDLTVTLSEELENEVCLETFAGSTPVAKVMMTVADGKTLGTLSPATGGEESLSPIERSIDELVDRKGKIPIHWTRSDLVSRFPMIYRNLGESTLAYLLALTRLVGMECPGLHSMFSGFSIDLDEKHGMEVEDGALSYEVLLADSRVSMVRMGVAARGLSGTVNAFLRPPPTAQPSMSVVSKTIEPDEFSEQKALVIGGSRGLGEITAKILAAGSGDVVVTYLSGQEDAETVSTAIREGGGTCAIQSLDVSDPEKGLAELEGRGWVPTHVYFFASPRITSRRQASFEAGTFRRFCKAYVEDFHATLSACRSVNDGVLKAFYPSSVAIDGGMKDLAEYAAAKSAGEALCRLMALEDDRLKILVDRLPALATDQTASLISVPIADPLDAMTTVVRKLADE